MNIKMLSLKRIRLTFAVFSLFLPLERTFSLELIGEGPNLGTNRIIHQEAFEGNLSLFELRSIGLKMFSTPFNKKDGYGGSFIPSTPIRPTLQNNGTFLRVNGLDAQSCLECHSIVSARTVPLTLGIGGTGGSVSNAMFLPQVIDPNDTFGDGIASFDGRFINPPFLFGSGGIELLGKEMTKELRQLRAQAIANPGIPVLLITKGVYFGYIFSFGPGNLFVSGIEGIDEDLVVRPFGRKGEFSTVRSFDVGAMLFHFGMQPVEAVGFGIDDDLDGVKDEVMPGEMTALSIFLTNLERPIQDKQNGTTRLGSELFQSIGCAFCHTPLLETNSTVLTYSFPEMHIGPDSNVINRSDLTLSPAGFSPNGMGGMLVPLFSDLKRHDMGPGLSESFSMADPKTNREFITARLWGVADTAPYLHDGRATTLGEAINLHGGEAQLSRDRFMDLSDQSKNAVLSFLLTLRTPLEPAKDLLIQ